MHKELNDALDLVNVVNEFSEQIKADYAYIVKFNFLHNNNYV